MDEMELARKLIKKFKTNNPFEICDCLDFITLSVPLVGIRGFYQYFNKNSIVYLSDTLDEHAKRFVCAHELGHGLMHRDSNEIFMDTRTFLKTSTYERQADRFAIDLILPDDDFYEDYKHLTINQIAHCFGSSEDLMAYRIGLIKKQAAHYCE